MKVTCAKCGIDFEKRPAYIRRTKVHFCSVRCFNGLEQNRMDLTGQVYGRLTVVQPLHRTGLDRHTRWLCKCSCGKQTNVGTGNLRSGKVISCGCALQKCHRKRPFEWLYNSLLNDPRGLSITILYEEFLKFTYVERCHYCEALISWEPYAYNNGKMSRAYNLDRKDNAVGYCDGNLVVCCKRCNYSKGDRFTYEEWHGMTAYLRGTRVKT